MSKYWKCVESGTYHTLEDCTDENCNGSEMMDEIINHYNKTTNGINDKSIIVDIFCLEHNDEQFFEFWRRRDTYREKGYDIFFTF